jgi:hypothetical protein
LLALGQGRMGLVGAVVASYAILSCYLHWSHRDYALLLMPLYAAFISIVMVPPGIVSYVLMAQRGHNAGLIRITRRAPSDGHHAALGDRVGVETRVGVGVSIP